MPPSICALLILETGHTCTCLHIRLFQIALMRLMLHSNFLFIFIRLTKNILTLQADEDLLSELEVDVGEECAKFGPVDNVKVHLATDMLLF